MRTAGYVRVSTAEQAADGYSIAEQTARIESYCVAKGWELIKIYADPGVSGAKIDRPALQELIRDCRKYEMILVYKLDRLSRSQKDTLYLIEDVFKPNNVNFASMQENFDTSTPLGMAMIGILSVFAQLEREQIKERMLLGKQGRHKEGLFMSSVPPLGYDYIDGKLVVNSFEAEQVREIFSLYVKGYGLDRIRRYMQERYASRAYTSIHTISLVLDNPVYVGKIKYKGGITQGIHESIIDDDLWQAVRSLRQKNSKKKSQNLLLSGLCVCGACGAKVRYGTVKRPNGKRSRYLRCSNFCGNPSMRSDVAEQAVLTALSSIRIENAKEKAQVAVDNSQKIAEIDRQIDRAMRLYTIECIDDTKVRDMITDLQSRRAMLEAEEKQPTENQRINAGIRAFRNLGDVIDTGDQNAIRDVLHLIIDHITVYEDHIDVVTVFE